MADAFDPLTHVAVDDLTPKATAELTDLAMGLDGTSNEVILTTLAAVRTLVQNHSLLQQISQLSETDLFNVLTAAGNRAVSLEALGEAVGPYHGHDDATQADPGFMSAQDKARLDVMATYAVGGNIFQDEHDLPTGWSVNAEVSGLHVITPPAALAPGMVTAVTSLAWGEGGAGSLSRLIKANLTATTIEVRTYRDSPSFEPYPAPFSLIVLLRS